MLDPSARQDLYAVEQRLGFRAVVGLDDAGDDVDAGGALGARGLEHRVGLADAGGGAEEDLQLAPRPPRLFITHVRAEGIGIGPPLGHAGAECTAAMRDGCVVSLVARGGRARARSIRTRLMRSQPSITSDTSATAANSSASLAESFATDVSITPMFPNTAQMLFRCR